MKVRGQRKAGRPPEYDFSHLEPYEDMIMEGWEYTKNNQAKLSTILKYHGDRDGKEYITRKHGDKIRIIRTK